MNLLPEKKYEVPSQNFVEKNVLCEKGDKITRFDGTYTMCTISDTDCVSEKPLLDDFGHSFLVQVLLIILF